MIKNNIMSGVTKNIEDTVKSFDFAEYKTTYGFNSPYAEIKIATLLYATHYWLLKKPMNQDQCYELYVGIKKILCNITTNKNISKIACDDLAHAHNNLGKLCNFTYETMFSNFPRLCLMTDYDTVFRNLAIKPYESQTKLIDAIKTHKKGLFNYKAAIGGGKTTVAIAFCEYVITLRISQKANNSDQLATGGTQFIFACSVEPVRHQVCQMAYNQCIPFGIGSIGEDKIVHITNNYNCKSDSDRILIVCDLDCAIELLNKSQNYVLFVDEPTVGADQRHHPVTNAVAKIIVLAPEKTILCSATLPETNEIAPIITYFSEKHVGAKIESIYSKESMIGCELINFDGYTLLPHNNCLTCEELQIIVNNLKTQSFIDRLYTAPVLYRLRKRLLENNIPNVINLETYFSNMGNLTQTNIQKAAIELLEGLLLLKDNSIIAKICQPLEKIDIDITSRLDKQIQMNDSSTENSNEGFAWDNEDKSSSSDDIVIQKQDVYDLNKIFMEQAYMYMGHCLVISKDPLKFAFDKSKTLLNNCDTASKIISKYTTSGNRFKQSLEKLESIKNEDDRSKKEQEIKNECKLSIDFPSILKLNTIDHLMQFAPHMKDKIDSKMFQFECILENIPLDFNIPDWVMLLLFAGVGIYQPHNKILCDSYNEYVLNMAANGQLAFLISDDSICYGANYPFNHVVIEDDIIENHSIGTLFQLIGRTGRVGKSWVGYAHIGQKTSMKIMNYIKGNESNGISDEAKNMNIAFKTVLNEIRNVKPNNKINQHSVPMIKPHNIIPLSDVVPIDPVVLTKQHVAFNIMQNKKNDIDATDINICERSQPIAVDKTPEPVKTIADTNPDWRKNKKPWELASNNKNLDNQISTKICSNGDIDNKRNVSSRQQPNRDGWTTIQAARPDRIRK